VTGRRERRHMQLLGDLEEKRRYWELKYAAIYRNVWRTHFVKGYGSAVMQTTE